MAILKKPYELSLWKEVWDNNNQYFDEQKISVIGSDDMVSQDRAIEPVLTRNVNGSKKLTFKMYKQYVDTTTGETVHNPFTDMLISESKIKLNYNGKWFDFIVKNIVENSSTHLCTYQLEDAFVNELSKNGFNKVLSTELTNNTGDVNTLARNLLDETDWRIGSTSEKIVQTIEDALVYVTIPKGTTIYHLLDQRETERTKGVVVEKESGTVLGTAITALAFYTSCKNKPHRFQFIYSDKGYAPNDKGAFPIARNQERLVVEPDCQYYCEIDTPEDYIVEQYNLTLPAGWSFSPQTYDELISSLYRGNRYGFAQQSKYIPEIDRYVYLYKKDGDDKEYYGYQYNEYASATTISDIITNSGFKGAAGWVGHTTEEIGNKTGVKKATVESVYGRFKGTFISLTDDLQGNDYKPDDPEREYRSYLKFSFEDNADKKQIVFNSGPYNHRYSIKEMPVGSIWAVRCVDANGTNLIDNNNLVFELAEYIYNTDTDCLCYQKTDRFVAELVKDEGKYRTYTTDGETYYFFEVKINNFLTEAAFTKNSEVRLAIKANNTYDATYYIKEIELFRALYTKEETPKLLIPNEKHIDDVFNNIKNQIVFSEYRYFSKEGITDASNEKEVKLVDRSETLTYKVYKPVYNQEAEKINSIEEKESNYFNILQSLAETFECWLDVEIGRDSTGKILRREDNTLDKNIVFKNYVGQKNYASFRYGVNLKDIQRTYESKNIVTKLVVKANANEHAPNGFCTIQRAGANTTGENYLYDFGYYHNMGMLDAETYLSIVQDSSNNGEWKGPDFGDSAEINLKGYNIRISNLNKAIREENERLVGLAQDLTNLSAQKKTAEAMLDAAEAGVVEVEADYERVAKQHITASLTPELLNRDDVKSLLVEYGTYISERDRQQIMVDKYTKQYNALKEEYAALEQLVKTKTEHKKALNTKFYNTYSRFIQEGTWVDEEYVDDDKYYNDAKSVIYNSCYPQVAYNIKVLALSMLPGYELFDFDLGDQTNVVDPEFFGEQNQEEVTVTEITESLDDPTKNTIKVQNFKNQFQDLFQKITATVQQTQYSTGAYQKAVSLAYAEDRIKMAFLNEALNSAGAMLTAAGQQTVTWGDDGITVTDVDTPCNELRMIGGAILLSKQDEKTGQKKWVSAVTSEGISANLITAGVVNTGKIAIMNSSDQRFLWDANGLNAFGKTDNILDTHKFVRFSGDGIYGINDPNINGASWVPSGEKSIDEKATFALTWEGLKVTGSDGVVARIGNDGTNIINITKTTKNGENPAITPLLTLSKEGGLEINGKVTATTGEIGNWHINKENGMLHSEDKSIFLTSKGVEEVINDANHSIVFKAGDNFKVDKDGHLFAQNGTFSGNIVGGTIEIGGEPGKPNFKVESDGSVQLNGNITWGTDASPTQAVYARTSITKPANNTSYSTFPDESSSGWHKIFNNTYDYFASYTYDGGKTWSETVRIRGTNGSDASVNSANVFAALTNDGKKFGCFYDQNDKLYINAEYIRAGEISANILASGKFTCSNLNATGGSIGGWYIYDGGLSSQSQGKGVTLTSSGVQGITNATDTNFKWSSLTYTNTLPGQTIVEIDGKTLTFMYGILTSVK